MVYISAFTTCIDVTWMIADIDTVFRRNPIRFLPNTSVQDQAWFADIFWADQTAQRSVKFSASNNVSLKPTRFIGDNAPRNLWLSSFQVADTCLKQVGIYLRYRHHRYLKTLTMCQKNWVFDFQFWINQFHHRPCAFRDLGADQVCIDTAIVFTAHVLDNANKVPLAVSIGVPSRSNKTGFHAAPSLTV